MKSDLGRSIRDRLSSRVIGMNIRAMTKGDYDYVVSVLDRWWGGPSTGRIEPILFYELGHHALVAEAEEEGCERIGFLLGFVAPTDPAVGYIHLVGIHPDHRRRGVGNQLYQSFTDRCTKAGVARLKAITTVGDDASDRFHRALGFTGQKDPDYAGPGRARLVFTKDL